MPAATHDRRLDPAVDDGDDGADGDDGDNDGAMVNRATIRQPDNPQRRASSTHRRANDA